MQLFTLCDTCIYYIIVYTLHFKYSLLLIGLITDFRHKPSYERVRTDNSSDLTHLLFFILIKHGVFIMRMGMRSLFLQADAAPKSCVIEIGLHRLPFDFCSPSSDIYDTLIL